MRLVAAILGLALLGCDGDPVPLITLPLVESAMAAVPRAQATTGLEMKACHVVLGQELVCGVLSVRNTTNGPIALIDRWNSWGSRQWTITIGEQEAINPQMSWYADHYTETRLAPGETRHRWFTLARQNSAESIRVDPWKFVLFTRCMMWVGQELREFDSFKPFLSGQPVTVQLEGASPESPFTEGVLPAPQWTGIVSVPSTEVDCVEELESLVQGLPLG